ncbi:MAG: TlpA family protein disulfide reductase [Bacteroidota bacterium]
MKIIRIIFLFLLILPLAPAEAQDCRISGMADDYGKGSYPVYTVTNPVSLKTLEAGKLEIGDDGHFKAVLKTEVPCWFYSDIGIYRMMLFTEPGHDYEVVLPPFREKSDQQKLNPYFEPITVHLRVLKRSDKSNNTIIPGDEEINDRLYRFDTLFFSMSDRVLLRKRDGFPVSTPDSIRDFELQFNSDTSVYFRSYRNYRYGLLELSAGTSGLGAVRDLYLSEPVPRYREPAYMELFDKMFNEFLVFYGRTPEGRDLVAAVNKYHNLGLLRECLRKHPAVKTDTIADLVILKDLYSQFFKETFYRESIIMLLDSLIDHPALPDYGRMAGEIKTKLTTLVPGNLPPDFSLTGMDGQKKSLEDFRGKYVYLFFCTPDNYSCMIEYPYLKTYFEKHSAYLEVVNIMICDNSDQMTAFMKNNGYRWPSLFYGDQPEVLIDYDVRIFPASYLIGPDGKLILAPAKLPSEGFEQSLFKIMRSRGDI